MDRVKRIWYLSHMRAAKVQASLRIRAVSPEPSLLAHTSSESRGTFRQKARSIALLNGWACAVKICHDGMLEDTNSLDGAKMKIDVAFFCFRKYSNFMNRALMASLDLFEQFFSLLKQSDDDDDRRRLLTAFGNVKRGSDDGLGDDGLDDSLADALDSVDLFFFYPLF